MVDFTFVQLLDQSFPFHLVLFFFLLLPFIEVINPLGIRWAECWVHTISTPALGSAWVSSFQKYLRGSQTCLDETVFNNGVRVSGRERERARASSPSCFGTCWMSPARLSIRRTEICLDVYRINSWPQSFSRGFGNTMKMKSSFWFQSSCDLRPQLQFLCFQEHLDLWLMLK